MNKYRQFPYQEKHAMQQVSIIGNMEAFGIVKKPSFSGCAVREEGIEDDGWRRDEAESLAVVEFGAGRGYLTHMLADCYETMKIILVERWSYKLKIQILCPKWGLQGRISRLLHGSAAGL